MTDKNTSEVPKYLQPVFIGFTLLAVGVSYGANSGYALNPVSSHSVLSDQAPDSFLDTGSRFRTQTRGERLH